MFQHLNEDEDEDELKVLVVDDDMDAATTLSDMLRLMGCKTAFAFGIHTALRTAQMFKPNVVFLDLDMPSADGCEVLHQLREQDRRLSGTLYVCLTGSTDGDAQRRCLEAGFSRFVSKPIGSSELADILTEGRLAASGTFQRSPLGRSDSAP